MTPSEFVTKWEALHANESLPDWRLVNLDPTKIGEIHLPQSSLKFLQEAGLPKAAAPFLDFADIAAGLKRIYEVYGIPKDWDEDERVRLKSFFVIGTDGSGSPFCLDEDNQGRVVLIDHENWFVTIQFVNSSIAQFAECLLLFASFCKRLAVLSDINDPEKSQLIKDAIEKLLSEIEKVDAEAIKENCFWREEIQMTQYW